MCTLATHIKATPKTCVLIAVDQPHARVADALYSGGPTCSPTKYAATFVYQASTSARGIFTISPRINETHLRDPDGNPITWSPGTIATVRVFGP